MKALQAASIIVVEKWNESSFAASRSADQIAPETALRLPGVIVGALTSLLIYLITAELFGAEVALIAAALWAFDPTAIGFNRVAKEDTFLLFFFLLANVFWLKGQRIAESTNQNPNRYYWLSGAAFGAMIASKYVPHLIGISIAYYWMFQNLPETKWRLGKVRLLTMFFIMGLVFLILSPTILLPETWRQMGLFASSKRVSHDGYEFMGRLYTQGFSDWLRGLPVFFYPVFTWVKLPVLTVAGFVIGLPLLFRRRFGDGRYFILFWLFLWFISFGFNGGKFTRYYTTVLPAVLITSALGIQWVGRWMVQRLPGRWSDSVSQYLPAAFAVLVITCSVISSAQAAPHYRLFTNVLGGGMNAAGYYFPHDEFYDASLRDTIGEIAKRAHPAARVASESPLVTSYYAQRVQRPDLVTLSLSDPESVRQLAPGDFIIVARGRRYFSNDALVSGLPQVKKPDFEMFLGSVHSTDVYLVDEKVMQLLR